MNKQTAAAGLLGVCVILAVLLLLGAINGVLGGCLFAAALAGFGLLSRGYRGATPAVQTLDTTAAIIALERAALDRWGKGDPSGFIDISAGDVVYFDPYLSKRLDGLDALKAYYASLRGRIHIDRDEMLEPRVQAVEDMAVLTFSYGSWTGDEESRWNCTEVYRHQTEGWRIIQTHWSLVHPAAAGTRQP